MNKEQVLNVIFTKNPDVKVRVINQSDNELIKKNKKQYPFELNNNLKVIVITNKRNFQFYIYKGYLWNGADIPRIFWRIVGSQTDNEFLIASLLHDYLLDFKLYMINEILNKSISKSEYRRLTSLIFRYILKEQGTNTVKANIMSWCVQTFQVTCCRKAWNI